MGIIDWIKNIGKKPEVLDVMEEIALPEELTPGKVILVDKDQLDVLDQVVKKRQTLPCPPKQRITGSCLCMSCTKVYACKLEKSIRDQNCDEYFITACMCKDKAEGTYEEGEETRREPGLGPISPGVVKSNRGGEES